MERLPLSSVRTFVVVARLLSISRSADEMNLTASAVSHQIKRLENYLGIRLFRRDKNKLTLTTVGHQYVAQVSEALLLLTQASQSIKAANGRQILRIGATPSLGGLWLVGRLHRFVKRHPEFSLDLTTVPDPAPLLPGSFDVAFWYGAGNMPGMTVDALGPNWAFPICKPTWLNGEHALESPTDLARCTLLDSSDDAYFQFEVPHQPNWAAWLRAAGISEFPPVRQMRFTPRVLMHNAVATGLGIGLTRSLLAVDALASKSVAIPFGPALPLAATYNLIFPNHLARRKDIAAFRDWVSEEAQASKKQLDKILRRYIHE